MLSQLSLQEGPSRPTCGAATSAGSARLCLAPSVLTCFLLPPGESHSPEPHSAMPLPRLPLLLTPQMARSLGPPTLPSPGPERPPERPCTVPIGRKKFNRKLAHMRASCPVRHQWATDHWQFTRTTRISQDFPIFSAPGYPLSFLGQTCCPAHLWLLHDCVAPQPTCRPHRTSPVFAHRQHSPGLPLAPPLPTAASHQSPCSPAWLFPALLLHVHPLSTCVCPDHLGEAQFSFPTHRKAGVCLALKVYLGPHPEWKLLSGPSAPPSHHSGHTGLQLLSSLLAYNLRTGCSLCLSIHDSPPHPFLNVTSVRQPRHSCGSLVGPAGEHAHFLVPRPPLP